MGKSKKDYYNEVNAIVKSKNGKLLSNKYINAKSNLNVVCVNGHQFITSSNAIKNGNWCAKCPRTQYSINDLKSTAALHDGFCLSTKYMGSKHIYLWKCKNGHEWEETYYYVKNFDQWCKKCKKESTKLSWSTVQDRVRRKGGYILSRKEDIKLDNQYIQLQCFSGHRFKRTIADLIYKDDRWCSECNKSRIKKKYYYRLKKFTLQNGYQLIEKFSSYNKKRETERVSLICDKGHEWSVSPNNLFRNRQCKICSFDNRRITENELLKIASEREGALVTPYKDYKHSKQHLLWECSLGHKFTLPLEYAFRGAWCTTCNIKFISEAKCKYIIEQLTGLEFIKTRSILTNKVNNDIKTFLELDMYNKALHLALEYNGEQHYKYVPYFHNDIEGFHNSLERDRIKQQACDKLKIKLIIVPFNLTSDDDKIEFIRNELERLQVPIQKSVVNMNDYYKKGGTINDH